VLMIVALTSAASAMTMIGPRVYAAMAQDGFLPRVFRAREGQPPLWATLLQSALAVLLLWTVSFLEILQGVGAILTLNASLVALGLIRARFHRGFETRRPPTSAVITAFLFVAAACVLVYGGVKAGAAGKMGWTTLRWLIAIVAFSAIAYVIGVVARRRD
jgi:amino acid transporter